MKILRERKTAFLRFEDDLYVYVVQSSRLSQVYVHSIFWCIFYLLCWWKHRWKWVGEHFLSKIGEIISINVENIGKQFSRIDTHRVAWNIFKKRMSLIYIYIVHIFHITFLSNALQTILLRFDQTRTIFQISSIQTFPSFLSNIYIYIFFLQEILISWKLFYIIYQSIFNNFLSILFIFKQWMSDWVFVLFERYWKNRIRRKDIRIL